MIRRRLPSLLVLVLAALLGSAATVAAAGISLGGKLVVDPAPNTVVSAGVPIRFAASGSFKPPDADATPWIQFVWDFGDGTASVSHPRYNGAGSHTDEVTHTFAAGGLYDVSVTGGHGFDFLGFRFSKTKTVTVRVECPGSDPGPKKCGKGQFSPFAGTWKSPPILTSLPDATLTLQQFGAKVLGTLEYPGLRDKKVNLLVEGKMKHKVEEGIEVLVVNFTAGHTVETPKGVVTGRLVMPITEDLDAAYRAILVQLEDAPALLSAPGPSDAQAPFALDARAGENTAEICTSVRAGKRKVKPGELVVFAVVVGNEGLASLPARRTRMDLVVNGGTIEPFPMLLERAVLRPPGFDPTQLQLDLGALGAGKGQKNAGAEAILAVRANAGATAVTLDATVFDNPEVSDAPFVVQPPPLRRLCVPVFE